MDEVIVDNVATDAQQEPLESPEVLEEVNSSEDVNTQETEAEVDGDIPHELQVKMGKIVATERKRAREQALAAAQLEKEKEIARVKQELEARFYANQAPTQGMIYDPITGREEDINSMRGQVLLRERELLEYEKRSKEQQAQLAEAKVMEKFQERLANAQLKFKDFDQTIRAIDPIASKEMIVALANTKAPEAILNFIAKDPATLEKLRLAAQEGMTHEQVKVIYQLENRFSAPKKLTTSANPAPAVSGSPKNLNAVPSQSQEYLDQIISEIREQRGGKWAKRR